MLQFFLDQLGTQLDSSVLSLVLETLLRHVGIGYLARIDRVRIMANADFLISCGANVNQGSGTSEPLPMSFYIPLRGIDVMRYLLDHGMYFFYRLFFRPLTAFNRREH